MYKGILISLLYFISTVQVCFHTELLLTKINKLFQFFILFLLISVFVFDDLKIERFFIIFFGCSTKQHFNVNQKKYVLFIFIIFWFCLLLVAGKKRFFLIDYFIWRYFFFVSTKKSVEKYLNI